ncbi:helix-turn-helix domain-containing protein [Parapedobacter sp. 10938]|uniref:helix-turn-helix domain-containing protein n=1 Tax=Parapedobacter flavus TaxID=3110225 RepID=UPI002DB93978|nr:helix-turn-helix transcriptional regulator [Parapedobacter sp. 10938]MEC3881821.1 helix-turn-helix transcriptional regulator [Parapedobacter sp. 10938]
MTDINPFEIEQIELGSRLRILREDYKKRTNLKAFTQGQVAEMVNLPSQSYVSMLEKGKGSAKNFISLILLFNHLGYNINWMLQPDNSGISMMNPKMEYDTVFEDIDIDEILVNNHHFSKRIKEAIAQLVQDFTNKVNSKIEEEERNYYDELN